MQELLDLAHKVENASEETFELFALLRRDGADLGMLAPKQDTLDLTIGPYDLTITQSPGLLQSANTQGTTGAAVWQSGIRLAKWLVSPQCLLLEHFPNDSRIVELGSGMSGVVSSVLTTRLSKAAQILATDMRYAMKGLRINLEAHRASISARKQETAVVQCAAMDWETDDASSSLKGYGYHDGADLVVACDCIYNYALIRPFLDTCEAICTMRNASTSPATVCLIVQQLRQSEVLEEWLDYAIKLFYVWRLPADVVGEDLSEERGYVVHLLVLR